MDGDSISHEKGTANSKGKSGISILGDSDVSEPPRVRHIGLQTDRINQRLLEYNVYSLWISICIILIVSFIL